MDERADLLVVQGADRVERRRVQRREVGRGRVYDSILDTIGNTPLIRLQRASEATGCTILGKAEFLNPGQSVKDRAALFIIRDAERRGLLRPGGVIGKVAHALHTPLMSVTNAISGIIVVGALVQIGSEDTAVRVLAFVAVLLASINVFGGFAVTRRMLSIFQRS